MDDLILASVILNKLFRTKHLLFSSHVPVLLVVLKVVDASLRDLHNFPDDHLPMIHQNWPALLNILQNKNLNVRVSGFQVQFLFFFLLKCKGTYF